MDCKVVNLWLFIMAAFFSAVSTTHILGIPPIGASHGRVLEKLGKELARRDYNYTLVIPKYLERYFKAKSPGYEVKTYRTHYSESDVEAVAIEMLTDGMFNPTRYENMLYTMCEELLNNKAHFDDLGQVDVVICDTLFTCCTVVADMLNVTIIYISTMEFADPLMAFDQAFSSPPAYVPQLFVPGFPRQMSLLDRTKNTMLNLAGHAFGYYYTFIYEQLKEKYAPNSPYQDLISKKRSTGMILVQADFALTIPRPLPPHVKVVGAILPEMPNKLPQNILDVMSTKSDVIIVSMGTVISNFVGSYRDILATAFTRIPATVIWKNRGNVPSGLGNNTVLFPWIPQNDLLGHAKVKLFVSHCGMNSMLEAAFHGVPVVAIPSFADQFTNAQALKEAGIAEVIKFTELDADDLTSVILKMLNEKSYRENARRVSKKMMLPGCDREGCVKLVADWAEYGMKTNGALHFRTEMDHLSFIQLYLIDVMLLMVAVVVLVVAVLVFTCNLVLKICKRKNKTD